MSRVSTTLPTTPANVDSRQSSQALGDVNLDDFLNLMLAELQNQDPLNPLDNHQMLQQVTQLREIGSNDRLSDTLSAVLAGQQINTAGALIGKRVKALDADAKEVTGVVDRVTFEVNGENRLDRKVKVHLGGKTVDLNNVREIL